MVFPTRRSLHFSTPKRLCPPLSRIAFTPHKKSTGDSLLPCLFQYTSTCHWLLCLSLPKKSSHLSPLSPATRSSISWMPGIMPFSPQK